MDCTERRGLGWGISRRACSCRGIVRVVTHGRKERGGDNTIV